MLLLFKFWIESVAFGLVNAVSNLAQELLNRIMDQVFHNLLISLSRSLTISNQLVMTHANVGIERDEEKNKWMRFKEKRGRWKNGVERRESRSEDSGIRAAGQTFRFFETMTSLSVIEVKMWSVNYRRTSTLDRIPQWLLCQREPRIKENKSNVLTMRRNVMTSELLGRFLFWIYSTRVEIFIGSI